MSELTRRFRDCLRSKQFDELEGVWLELVGSAATFDDLMAEAELADKWAPPETARAMLSVWADLLRDSKHPAEQLAVLRRLIRFNRNDLRLARELADCLRHLHADAPDFDRLLQKAGLGFGKPIDTALSRLERLLSLAPGSLVLDASRGPGEVTRLDLLLDRVEVDFAGTGRIELKTETAAQLLSPLGPEGFYWLVFRDRPALDLLVSESPADVVRRYLRDVAVPKTPAEIKTGLGNLVPEPEWPRFWESARRDLSTDPHVRQLARPSRSLQWSDEPVRQPSSDARRRTRATVPAVHEPLPDAEPAEVSAGFERLTSFSHRRQFIEALAATGREDLPDRLSDLFRHDRDRRTQTLIADRLATGHPEHWQALVDELITDYRRNPGVFAWLVENRERLGREGRARLLTRVIDLLESQAHRRHRTSFKKLLDKQARDLLAAALDQVDSDGARKLLARITRLRDLSDFRRDELRSDLFARFPELEERSGDSGVLTTQAGLDRAREELRQMVDVELPKTADELARARAHGDLSENYEYKAAKEKQARLMARINRLQSDLGRAHPLDPARIDTNRVSVGCRVRLTDDQGEAIEFTILGPWDSDIENRVISYLAPLGRRLLDRKPGDFVELDGRHLQLESIANALSG